MILCEMELIFCKNLMSVACIDVKLANDDLRIYIAACLLRYLFMN